MEEDILNYLYQLSCFVGHPVSENLRRLNHFVNLNKSYIKILLSVLWVYFGAKAWR